MPEYAGLKSQNLFSRFFFFFLVTKQNPVLSFPFEWPVITPQPRDSELAHEEEKHRFLVKCPTVLNGSLNCEHVDELCAQQTPAIFLCLPGKHPRYSLVCFIDLTPPFD